MTTNPNTRWQIRVPTATSPQGEVISWTSPTQPTEEDIADILAAVGIDHSPGTPLPELQTGYSGAPGRLPVSPKDPGMTPPVPTGIGRAFSEFFSAMGSDAPLPPVDEMKSGWIRGGYPYAELAKGIVELGKNVYRDPNAAVGDAARSLVMPNAERFNLGKEQVQSFSSVIPGALNLAGGLPLVGPIFGRAADMASDIGQGRILEAGMQAPLLAADLAMGRYAATKAATKGQQVIDAVKRRRPAATPSVTATTPPTRGVRWQPTPDPVPAASPVAAAAPDPRAGARRQQIQQAILDPSPKRAPSVPAPPVVPAPVSPVVASPAPPARRPRAAKKAVETATDAATVVPAAGRIGVDVQSKIKSALDKLENATPPSSPDGAPVVPPTPVAAVDPPPTVTRGKASSVSDGTIVATSTGESVDLATLGRKELNKLYNAASPGFTSFAYLLGEGNYLNIVAKLKKQLADPKITKTRYEQVEDKLVSYEQRYASAQAIAAYIKKQSAPTALTPSTGATKPFVDLAADKAAMGGKTVKIIEENGQTLHKLMKEAVEGLAKGPGQWSAEKSLAVYEEVDGILKMSGKRFKDLKTSLKNKRISQAQSDAAEQQLIEQAKIGTRLHKDIAKFGQ